MTIGQTVIERLPQIILAIGAIGTTAFSLVDALKVVPWTSVSRIGLPGIRKVYAEMGPALKVAIGDDWQVTLESYWINGTPRDRQIAIVMGALRLGLNDDTYEALAKNARLKPESLKIVVALLNDGQLAEAPPVEVDADGASATADVQQALNVLGRLDAYYRTRLDAAFALADHNYRNGARLVAGCLAVGLSVVGGIMVDFAHWPTHLPLYLGVGLLAVPLAPIAKDLSSAIKSVADNLKVVTGKA